MLIGNGHHCKVARRLCARHELAWFLRENCRIRNSRIQKPKFVRELTNVACAIYHSKLKNRPPDIIILNKQQKQAYLLDIAVPNSHNITQTYNTKINKYLELSAAMRNLWCLEKISILPLVISATGIVPQSLFKNLKILDLDNTLVVEIQKGILLYSCHIVRKFLNIDTEHNTQQSHNAEARRR
jgi:hypothetical protein